MTTDPEAAGPVAATTTPAATIGAYTINGPSSGRASGGMARKTIGHAGIYGAGTMLRHVVSVVMLPIYTRYLLPSDYGVLELLQMTLDVVAIFTGMRVGEAVFRYYCTADTERERREVIGTALGLSIALNLLAALVLVSLSGMIASALFGDGSLGRLLAVFSITLVLSGGVEICMTLLRARQLPWHFVGFSLAKLVLQVGLNIYFVVFLGMRVEGVIYSALIAAGAISALLVAYVVASSGFRFSIARARQLVGFSAPLMLAGLAGFYLTFADRFFLRVYHDLSVVGVYSLGYKFGFMLMVIAWDPFQRVWDAQRYDVLQRVDAREIYQRVFFVMSMIVIVAGLGMAVFARDLLRAMSDAGFWAAATVVPIVVAAYVLQCWTNYCRFGILLKGNTSQITYGNLAGAVIITAGYLLLIPPYGVLGAAWATVFGFAARLAWIQWQGERGYAMQLPWGRVARVSALAVVAYFLADLAPEPIWLSISTRGVVFLGFLALVTALVISPAERAGAVDLIRGLRRARAI